ncbi:MAG: ferredoxin [bacterium]
MIKVSHDLCIGCGTCAALSPKVFIMNAEGKSDVISQDDIEGAKNAAASCPVTAISVE